MIFVWSIKEPLKQYLLYIGKERCTMPQNISEPNLSYHYELVDMHTVNCETLLERNTPEALVLAILCDFKGRSAHAVVREIGTRLRLLMHNDDKGFLDYFSMLEILGQNRDLSEPIKETKEMLTQIDVSRLPSYQWGREDTLKEMQALMAEKETALAEKEHVIAEKEHLIQQALAEKTQQTLKLIKKMHLAGMTAPAIADLLEIPVAEVEQQLQQIGSTKN